MAKSTAASRPPAAPTRPNVRSEPKSESPSDSEFETESESEYSDEDEDGEELTPALDAAILRTLSKIRRKEGVYGTDNVLQEELKLAEAAAKGMGIKKAQKAAEAKPFLLRDLHRNNLLAGSVPDEDSEEPLTNVEAMRRARAEALSAFNSFAVSDEEDDDDEAGGLVRRERDEEEVEEDEAEYRKFLLEMGGGEDAVRSALGMGDQPVSRYREDVEDVEEDASATKKKSKAPLTEVEKAEMDAQRQAKRVQDDEDFLMSYILNRGWIDKSGKHVPTYEEIVGREKSEDEDEVKQEEGVHPWGKIDEEDDFDEQAEEFETAYNFRFEEPGSSNIATHPRQITTLVRRDDDKRKLKRQERAERKAAEKAAEEEKIRARKGEKRREMERLMGSLKEELGEDGMDWEELGKVMDGDFDECEWERVVGKMLEAKALAEDEQKPTWDDDLGDEYADEEEGEYGEDGNGGDVFGNEGVWDGDYEEEDGPINMDADFVDEPVESKRKQRKKNKGKGKQVEEVEEPEAETSVVDKAAKIKKAAEDYRALDHEDMIGDLPTRFKYTRSAPAAFGLTPVEILLSTDAELNSLVSVKHIAPYRRRGLGLAGQGLGKRVRDLKRELQGRKWGDDVVGNQSYIAPGLQSGSRGGPGEEGKKKKRLGKKQRLRMAAAAGGGEGPENQAEGTQQESGESGEKRKREGEEEAAGVAEGGEGSGKRRRRKKGKKGGLVE